MPLPLDGPLAAGEEEPGVGQGCRLAPGPILPAPCCPQSPGVPRCWGRAGGAWGQHRVCGCGTGQTPLTARVQEQEQGELQQEGCPGTAPGHGLRRGLGITWNRESGVGKGLGMRQAGGAVLPPSPTFPGAKCPFVTRGSLSLQPFCSADTSAPGSAALAAAGASGDTGSGDTGAVPRHSLPPAPGPGAQHPMSATGTG